MYSELERRDGGEEVVLVDLKVAYCYDIRLERLRKTK
jgi:hypothetical protein